MHDVYECLACECTTNLQGLTVREHLPDARAELQIHRTDRQVEHVLDLRQASLNRSRSWQRKMVSQGYCCSFPWECVGSQDALAI
jgi:hypothetical protein